MTADTTIDVLKKMCKDDPEALSAIDRALQGRSGAPKNNKNAAKEKTTLDNIQDSFSPKAPTGTSADRAIRKLRTEAEKPDAKPEVKATYKRVLAGEIREL